MNDLLGYNDEKTEKQLKAKKNMKIVGIILLILFIIFIGLMGLMYYIQLTQLKIYVDGKMNSELKDVIIIQEDGNLLIPIRSFAKYVNYNSYSGEYKQYEEDTTKCYVESKDEIASFTAGSNKIYKVSTSEENEYEYFTIQNPVIMTNGDLYTTVEGAELAFNIKIAYNKEKNTITINTLPYIVNYYGTNIKNTAILEEKTTFSNKKALLYDMVVMKNESNHYGVYGIDGKEILGMKYASVNFIEGTKEFIVKSAENKMGIVKIQDGKNGYTAVSKISPEYDSIKQIDQDSGLYLVTNNQKQGVVNNTGSYIVYPEYDQIGIDSSKFVTNNIKNKYLLYGKCIPVRKNQYWGAFDKSGKPILDIKFQEFGCVASSSNNKDKLTANSVLLIPKYEGIVVKDQDMYGIYNADGKQIIPTALQGVYSNSSKGEETYYMIYENQKMNVIDYIEEHKKEIDVQNTQGNNKNEKEETKVVKEEPKQGEPKKEEPNQEEPKKEEPNQAAPKKEEPVQNNPEQKVDANNAENNN